MDITEHGMAISSSSGALAQLFAQWDATGMALGSGSWTPDTNCWKGTNAQYTQPSSGMAAVTVASATSTKLRYGHFSVAFRIRSSNVTSTSAVATLKVTNAAAATVASIQLLGTDFAVAGSNIYRVYYLPFDNMGQSTGNAYTFSLVSEAVASVTIALDSILIAPVHLTNFGG